MVRIDMIMIHDRIRYKKLKNTRTWLHNPLSHLTEPTMGDLRRERGERSLLFLVPC